MSSQTTSAISSALRSIPVVLAGLALVGHVLVGWLDEGRLTLRPVGPLTVWVAVVWASAVLASLASLRLAPGPYGTRMFVIGLAVVALIALLVPS
jgi:hypothetical protein